MTYRTLWDLHTSDEEFKAAQEEESRPPNWDEFQRICEEVESKAPEGASDQ